MGVRQRLGRLQPPVRHLVRAEHAPGRARLVEDDGQALALDKLHGEIMDAVLTANAEDGHDVGVVQPGHRLGLALEACHRFPVGSGTEAQHLQGHFAFERQLLGFVDDTHAAAADLAHDAEVAQPLQHPALHEPRLPGPTVPGWRRSRRHTQGA